MQATRYLALVGVLAALAGAMVAFASGVVEAGKAAQTLVEGGAPLMSLVQLMDKLLVASGLLVFAFALYELFVGALVLPKWLVIEDLDGLKAKLAGVLVLAMVVSFYERLPGHGDAVATLYEGGGVALVIGALVLYLRLGR
jgi:uncharacterized membrane protein YqhA